MTPGVQSAGQGAYVQRLGRAHFAHLRAVVEGLAPEAAAQRYLAADTLANARRAHADVVRRLRAIARRRGNPAWRLIGLALAAPAAERPTLEQWADAKGLDLGDWGERELIELYEADFPPDRRQARAVRLRERQLRVLREIEPLASEEAQPTDLIEGWFDSVTAERLKRAGLLRLDELQQRIRRGGRWYRWVPAIGATKASRIAAYLAQLLPAVEGPPAALPVLASAIGVTRALPTDLDGSRGTNRMPVATAGGAGVQATNDLQAIEAWLLAKAGTPGAEGFSAATAKAYRLEAERLLLWCLIERGRPLSSMTAEDCAAYKAFLAAVPERWISRRRSTRYGTGWTPFAGQLSLASQQHAITIVGGLMQWLVDARYLQANPWTLVKRRLGDDPMRDALDSRAFTPAAWRAIVDYVDRQPTSPGQARAAFMLAFNEGAGLRAGELTQIELGALRQVGAAWVLHVHGKGSKNRLVALPPQSVRALEQYLASRGLPELVEAAERLKSTPLVASADDPMAPVGYRALYESMKSWFRRAIVASNLNQAEKDVALRASLHWLRHTCGTRALERGVDVAVVQGQFGHADPRTTMRYAKTQLAQRLAAVAQAFK